MNTTSQVSQSSEQSARWSFICGNSLPRAEVIYYCQVLLIYIVVVACLINLSIGGNNSSLWSSLLSGSVGYLLPSPKIKLKKDEPLLPNPSEQQ